MKKKDLKKMNDAELDKLLKDLRLELMKERGNIAMGGTVKNPGRIREIRKNIARILTIKTEREKLKG
ncbi:MAG: 50S ribosomal protein L29 [Candidatus Aenigmarchaeota archaeon]|nr:50S ribosomal protein L29 [Candidatus Aenigmarchaeota archaeon]